VRLSGGPRARRKAVVTLAEEAPELDDIPATIPETDDWYESQDDADELAWLCEKSEELRRQFPCDL
jgi:hypothetical protein